MEGTGGDGTRAGGVRPEWNTGRSDVGVLPPGVAIGREELEGRGRVAACEEEGAAELDDTALGLGDPFPGVEADEVVFPMLAG